MSQLIDIGYLTIGSEFRVNGERYKVLHLDSNKSVNSVLCQNLHNNKRKWFDLSTKVESED